MFNTIKNPKTGKLVKSGGNVGKQLIKNPGTHVYNPITGKNVKVDGRVGKMVMGGYRKAVMYGGIIYLKEVHDYKNGNYKDDEASLVASLNNNKPSEIQFILDYFKETNRTPNYANLFELYNLLIKHKPSTNDAYFDFLHKLDKYYINNVGFSKFEELLNDQDMAYKNNYSTNKQEVYDLLIEYKNSLGQEEFTTCKKESKRFKNPCRNNIEKGFNIPTIKNNLWRALARMIGPYIKSIRLIDDTELGQSDSLKHIIHTIPTNDSKPNIDTKFIQPIKAKIEDEKKKKKRMFEILNKWVGYDRDNMTEDEKNLVIKQLIKNQLDIIKDIDTTLNKLNNNWLTKQIQKDHTKSILENLKEGVKDSIKSTIIPEFISKKMLIISDKYTYNQEMYSKLIEELFEVIKVIDTTLNELSKKIQKEHTRLQKERTKSILEELKKGIKVSIISDIIPEFEKLAYFFHEQALKFKKNYNLKLDQIEEFETQLLSFRVVKTRQVILNPYVETVRELFEPTELRKQFELKFPTDYYIYRIKTLS